MTAGTLLGMGVILAGFGLQSVVFTRLEMDITFFILEVY
jgi:hypothetical protein